MTARNHATTCARKRPLNKLHAKNLARMNAGTFNAYRCPCGPHWHIGHPLLALPTPRIHTWQGNRITVQFIDGGYQNYYLSSEDEARFVLLCLRALLP